MTGSSAVCLFPSDSVGVLLSGFSPQRQTTGPQHCRRLLKVTSVIKGACVMPNCSGSFAMEERGVKFALVGPEPGKRRYPWAKLPILEMALVRRALITVATTSIEQYHDVGVLETCNW